MTRTEQGRLYRRTEGWTTRPLFQLYMDDRPSVYDEQISTVTIRRGLGAPGGGVAVSTMEVTVPHVHTISKLTGRTFGLNLLGSTSEQIANRTGHPSPLSLQPRFRGRIGPLRVTDTGKTRTSSTTITASSWIAQESTSKHRATLASPMHIDDAISALLSRSPGKYTFTAHGPWDSLLETIPDASYQDTIGHLTADYEVLVADRRNGSAAALSLPYRWDQAMQRINTTAHLTRSQAISPATWEQTSDSASRKYKFEMTDSVGTRWTTTRFLEEQVDADAETENIDWQRFGQLTEHWDYASRAIVHRDNIRAYSIPDVKVDLLRLLNSDNTYHRRQAGELLDLETGDSLNLSGDWPDGLQGVQIVTGITETITGQEWTMELALSPLIDVFGHYSPAIPALVWDAATYPWNTETRPWNH